MTEYYNLSRLSHETLDSIKEYIRYKPVFVLCFKNTEYVNVIREEIRCEAHIETFDINRLRNKHEHYVSNEYEYVSNEGKSYSFIGLGNWDDAESYISRQENKPNDRRNEKKDRS